jgi:glyoxylase-like metal-dependent hydrolase (beta-lactamase superfamily II)
VTRRLQRANPVAADIIFDDAGISLEEFGIPARVIPTPGHTPGSISVLLENGDAIVGDLVMSGPPLVLKPSLAVVAYDPAQMRESWLHLLELGAKTVYPAHGKPFPVEALRVLQKGIYTVIGSTVTLAP